NTNQNENGAGNGSRNRPETAGHTSPGVLSLFGRYSFPFLLASSVVKLSIYLNKLYQDSAAVGKYFTDKDLYYCIVSAFCLFLPAVLYILYIVGAYIKDQEETESKEVGTKVVHGLLLVPWQIKG
ncbi:XK-related protein, partial [Nephila pilipes]